MAAPASTIRNRLERATVIGSLSPAILDNLAKHAHLTHFSKGASVCSRGDHGDSMMIVDSGALKVYNVTSAGQEIVLNFLGQGDLMGELAVLDGQPRTANVVALEPTDVISLYRRDVLPLLLSNPEALMEVVQALTGKVRAASLLIEENRLPMTARTAAGLLRLVEQHGRKSGDGIRIDLALSQRDLGGYLDTSRPNANRQLGLLRDAGVLRFDQANIVILDLLALRRCAEADGE